MPRSKKSEEESVSGTPVRKPRTRTPRDGDAPVRKRPPRKARVLPVPDEVVEVPRKAPTPIAFEKKLKKQSTRVWIAIVCICVFATGAGVAIGMTDKGPIDVVAIVTERNEKVIRGEVRGAGGEAVTQTVPVQNADTRPNGGLQPATNDATPTPEIQENSGVAIDEAMASSTPATTTESVLPEETMGGSATSTTTDEIISEEAPL